MEYDTAWRKLWKHVKNKGWASADNEFIGLSFDDPNITKHEKCRYYACISVECPTKPEGEFGTIIIEKGKFAVFLHQGPYSGLNRLYKSIYLEWLPSNHIKLRSNMSFEKYLNNPGKVEEKDLLTEVYIPIQS
jgi:AraC family transcriptional regulator